MTWTPDVLLVGFDAMDRDVARQAMAAGRMPTLARLRREGTTAAMANPEGMLTGPVWATIATGVHPDRHNRLNWRVLRPGTYRMEWLGPHSQPDCPPFWERLAHQGRSSFVNSVPTIELVDHPKVTQINDWHTHDRRGVLRCSPDELTDRLVERHGPGAVDRCDWQGALGELDDLVAQLRTEVATFASGTSQLLDELEPDVAVAVSGASHCAGHQLWHLHDTASQHRSTAAQHPLGDALLDVYDELDAALARLLVHAGEDTLVIVVLSHGMGDNAVMVHLADPIVRAIDASMGPAPTIHRARELVRRTPNRVARLVLRRLGRPIDQLAHIADGSRRFFPVENFPTHTALRLNVVGREPNGRVARAEMSAVLDHLEAELLTVRDVDTGRPVVRRLIRLADRYQRVDASSLADVLVEWTGEDLVRGVTSPTIGTLRAVSGETRTGAHRQDGLVVLRGPGMQVGLDIEAASVDLWPTLARHLGVDSGDVDGQPLPTTGWRADQASP